MAARRYNRAMVGYRPVLSRWEAESRELRDDIKIAGSFTGATADDRLATPLQLHRDERVFCVLEGVALVEPRKTPGRWVGGYSGFSFRIAKGVRWNVGATKGHREPGHDVPTAIDKGTATITDRRVVFQGGGHAREWSFDKLLGYQHSPDVPLTTFQVVNREKASGLLYDREHAGEVHFRLALALAHHNSQVDEFVGQLQAEMTWHDRQKPPPPAMPTGVRSALPSGPRGG